MNKAKGDTISTDKFTNPLITAKGDTRAFVDLIGLETLWFNTGTQCNLKCENCYIESSPTNDRLVYLTLNDVVPYLDEIKEQALGTKNINFTGGEPFINPNIIDILRLCLSHGHEVLVLTNAYRILKRHEEKLLGLKSEFGDMLKLRISLDHYTLEVHEQERGRATFKKTLEQIKALFEYGFNISIAGRSLIHESIDKAKSGYNELLSSYNIKLDLDSKLVIFPEMATDKEVPEITTDCWGILNKKPQQQMCATERMIVKRKGDTKASIMPCTLLAYDNQFILGEELKSASTRVQLNHKFCAEFCVLGGASCSSAK